MSKTLTISGIEHMVSILRQHPSLLSLSSLAPINNIARMAKDAAAKSGCNCSIAPVYAANKKVFELALSNMGQGDHLTAKSILKVDQICYYTQDLTGKFQLKCI